jgi:hypothetical protein
MVDDSPAQNRQDQSEPVQRDSPASDSELLEDALQEALDAHAAGLLAAPFGVDEVALKRARRRALRADIKRLLAMHDSGTA